MQQQVSSWGRLRRSPHEVARPAFLDEARAAASAEGGPRLCFGMGRSYGDVCLNEGGRLIVTDRLDRIMAFDRERGVLRAEAGLTLDRLLRVTVPQGWFAPVVPGTKFVTLGGAVANDVHGKNHEHVGTFGRACAMRIGLARSSGEVLTLSHEENAELFAATIGGLGLTGVILWVELQLAAIRSAMFDTETLRNRRSRRLLPPRRGEQRLALHGRVDRLPGEGRRDSGADCSRAGGMRKAVGSTCTRRRVWRCRSMRRASCSMRIPSGRSTRSIRRRPFRARRASGCTTIRSCFRSTPSRDWNRLYGRRGFFQHQSAVPMAGAFETVRKLLELDRRVRRGLVPAGAEAVRRRAVARPAVVPAARRDAGARLPQQGREHAPPARPHGRRRARGRRTALSGEGRHDVGRGCSAPAIRTGVRSRRSATRRSCPTSGAA